MLASMQTNAGCSICKDHFIAAKASCSCFPPGVSLSAPYMFTTLRQLKCVLIALNPTLRFRIPNQIRLRFLTTIKHTNTWKTV